MKLQTLVEAVRRTSDDIQHDRATGRNTGPEDLSVFLDNMKRATDLEEAKEIGRRMSKFFAKGKQRPFLDALEKTTRLDKLLQLAYNTALAGEGLRVRR